MLFSFFPSTFVDYFPLSFWRVGGESAQRPVVRASELKKTGARSARAQGAVKIHCHTDLDSTYHRFLNLPLKKVVYNFSSSMIC
jgi:hypothetical protein